MKLYVLTVEMEGRKYRQLFFAESRDDFYNKSGLECQIAQQEIALTIGEIYPGDSYKEVSKEVRKEQALQVIRRRVLRGENFGVEIRQHTCDAKVAEHEVDEFAASLLTNLGLLLK